MKEFTYTISDPVGIHARPAGIIVNMCKGYESTVSIIKDDKTVSAGKLMALMGLGIKQGDIIRVTAEGPDEDFVIDSLEAFFAQNL